VENITVFPSFFNSRIKSRTSRLPTGSRPDIGSSRIILGIVQNRLRQPTRCSIPSSTAKLYLAGGFQPDPLQHALDAIFPVGSGQVVKRPK